MKDSDKNKVVKISKTIYYYYLRKIGKTSQFFLQSMPGGGAKWIPAWELHSRDPTLVMWKACYSNLAGGNLSFLFYYEK